MSTPAPAKHTVVIVHTTAAHSSSASAAALVVAGLAAVLILACAAWGAARWWAYEPHWLLSARHSFAEAGLRISASWGELTDWLRLGH
jgi:hypothetical protein